MSRYRLADIQAVELLNRCNSYIGVIERAYYQYRRDVSSNIEHEAAFQTAISQNQLDIRQAARFQARIQQMADGQNVEAAFKYYVAKILYRIDAAAYKEACDKYELDEEQGVQLHKKIADYYANSVHVAYEQYLKIEKCFPKVDLEAIDIVTKSHHLSGEQVSQLIERCRERLPKRLTKMEWLTR